MHPYALSYGALAKWLENLQRAQGHLLVAIDGPGASGKSSLAQRLVAALEHAQLVHVDDFYRPSSERYVGDLSARATGADFDLARLSAEVLVPVKSGLASSYHVYDWTTDQLAARTVALTTPIVVVEGVYSLSSALCALFGFSIWVDCPRHVRLARGLARDGEAARSRWESDWMLGEDQYLQRENPRDRASLVCDGNHEDWDSVLFVRSQTAALNGLRPQ